MKSESCSNCVYWRRHTGKGFEENGLCHRYAPSPFIGATAREYTEWLRDQLEARDREKKEYIYPGLPLEFHPHWPETPSGEWCGEWRAG
jgi:hypothetical protein